MEIQVGDWVKWDQPGDDGVFIDEVGHIEEERIYLEDGVGTIISQHQILETRPRTYRIVAGYRNKNDSL